MTVVKGKVRQVLSATGVALLALAGTVLVGNPASAAHVNCGAIITSSTTLDSNLVNCPGHGLIVTGSNLVLDLGGRTISGRTNTNTSPTDEFVGIQLRNVSNVTVRNGTITNFDAGISIGRGGGNTITGLYIHNNANHSTLTGVVTPCDFGDGIVTFDSDNNVIRANRLMHNGPFSGVALVGDSDGNIVADNFAVSQNVDNAHPNFVTPERPEGNGPCGPFVPGIGTVGAPRQAIGIRVEGPGANFNRVERNQVIDNDVFGITIHGHVCNPQNATPDPLPIGPQPANTDNVIQGNTVARNGFRGAPPASQLNLGDGIAIPAQGPANVVCVAHHNSVLNNTVDSNARWGIRLDGRGTTGNVISGNAVRNNGRDGIILGGPGGPSSGCGVPFTTPCPGAIGNTITGNTAMGNVRHDARDENPGCDANVWRNNHFRTVFQGCERGNG
jgi:parallel beta-helix repeat protein